MREKKRRFIITFETTTQAMEMERICGLNNIPGRIIPLPREISAGCGLSWCIDYGDYMAYKENIDSLNIEYDNIYELTI